MRTNIEIDDQLLSQAQRFSVARTKRGIVDEALRTFIDVRERDQATAVFRSRLEAAQRELAGRKFRETSADLIRRDRDRR